MFSTKDQQIIDAMLKTDIKFYESSDSVNNISLIHDQAYILKELKHKLIPGANVLDIGSGSGIFSVIFANMVNIRGLGDKPKGCVVGVDISKEVIESSLQNILSDIINSDLLSSNNQDFLK